MPSWQNEGLVRDFPTKNVKKSLLFDCYLGGGGRSKVASPNQIFRAPPSRPVASASPCLQKAPWPPAIAPPCGGKATRLVQVPTKTGRCFWRNKQLVKVERFKMFIPPTVAFKKSRLRYHPLLVWSKVTAHLQSWIEIRWWIEITIQIYSIATPYKLTFSFWK